ncbi:MULTISPECIES: LON peptidase substrate-binding domain-containing protein [unclassified Marinovum]
MISASNLPDMIPVFPLPGTLLLPRARLPLHIFEPRFLAMIEDCMKTPERLIGMIQPSPRPGHRDNRLHSIGCAGRLTQFSETEDGRFMVTLAGVSRFRIRGEVEGFTAYRRFNVGWSGFEQDLEASEQDPSFDRAPFMELLSRFFDARELSADWETLTQASDELLINSLSMMLEFEAEEKQALLEAPSLSTRRETLVTLLEFALRGGNTEEIMQ